jgi:hypothetical protein
MKVGSARATDTAIGSGLENANGLIVSSRSASEHHTANTQSAASSPNSNKRLIGRGKERTKVWIREFKPVV